MKLIPVNSGNSRRKAFTLIELMVALIVVSIMICTKTRQL